ncbi:uncharacterized protein TNCV_4983011 [Trichonephila clavipes]|uniref:Uncharacterized protein n=1 Tax=Trichonephila clavipes TaxID=2585209 RepID=A0A8X7BK26_TRICX|nr:uncharacterized protein TNCV_4983011 [Trichonephila clavipes]
MVGGCGSPVVKAARHHLIHCRKNGVGVKARGKVAGYANAKGIGRKKAPINRRSATVPLNRNRSIHAKKKSPPSHQFLVLLFSPSPGVDKPRLLSRIYEGFWRNSEPWVTWTTPELAPPLLTTTPHQREDVSALDRFNVHRCPHGSLLELVTRQATIRYLYHSATAAVACMGLP